MNFIKKICFLGLGCTGLICSFSLHAERLGIHCWRQQPFNHIFCFEVDNLNNQYFSLIGEDIIIGEGRYPVSGSAVFDATNGVYRLEFTQNLGNTFVFENTATIDSNLNGQWNDDGGNSGDFLYLGPGPLTPETIEAQVSTRRNKRS
ncbi:MAG: hypothetical protein SVR94_01500 [Pseudomonadota bacterium]|nr:hypothetical protein [Pseudomonadota bacterium]